MKLRRANRFSRQWRRCFQPHRRRRRRRVVMVVATRSLKIVRGKLTNRLRDNEPQLPARVRDRMIWTFSRRPQSKRNQARSNSSSTCEVTNARKSRCRRVAAQAEGKRRWSNDAAGTRAPLRSEPQVHALPLTRRCARLLVSKDGSRPLTHRRCATSC